MQNTETAPEADQAFLDLLEEYKDLGLTVKKLYEWVPPSDGESDTDWLKRARGELILIRETFEQVG